ncbi:MAG: ribulose-phosphate 3-epimerase [Eubacteriales bacterium]
MKLAPSILSANFTRLAEDIQKAKDAGAVDLLHVDVMDGMFVPNITIGAPVVKALRKEFPDMVLDVHLMIDQPERYIDDFAAAGSDMLSVHAEATRHLQRLVTYIRSKGMKACVALNPATPLSALDYVLEDIDMVLIMTVNPGFGGQKFIPQSLGKIAALREIIDRRGLPVDIQIDGGATPDNIGAITQAGADIAVAGSAIFGAPDMAAAVRAFHANAKR